MSSSQGSGNSNPPAVNPPDACRVAASHATDRIVAGLDSLAAADVAALEDPTLRGELLDLMAISHRVSAELIRRLDILDRRGLCHQDGFRTTVAWLRAFTRRSGAAAQRLVTAARVLRRLPKLATAVQAGHVPDEHVQLVVRLSHRVDLDQVAEVEPILADAARQLDPARFATVCDRVAAHLDPDGPDPEREFQRRSFTLSPTGSAVGLRGQLDPEGAAAVATALNAVMTPPAAGDERTATQRRADALVDLARRHLSAGTLPDVGGQRPQVGLLVHPQALSPETLARLADIQRDSLAGQRLRTFLDTAGGRAGEPAARPADWSRPLARSTTRPEAEYIRPDGGTGRPLTATGISAGEGPTGMDPARQLFGRTTTGMRNGLLTDPAPVSPPRTNPPAGRHPPRDLPQHPEPTETTTGEGPTAESPSPEKPPAGNKPAAKPPAERPASGKPPTRQPAWDQPGWADPPWLNWVGPVTPQIAQRIACDADLVRIVMDPDTGMPLDVGRTHRLIPHWIRKVLHARDRGCRWPGCTTPTEWTDGHHLDWWSKGGKTSADRCLLICRHHHVLLHEGGWRIDLDITTGEVSVTRPDGSPYALNPSPSWRGTTNFTRTHTRTHDAGTSNTGNSNTGNSNTGNSNIGNSNIGNSEERITDAGG